MSSRRRVLCGLLVVAAVVAGCAGGSGTARRPAPAPTPSAGRPALIAVGTTPVGLTVDGEGRPWVVGPADGTVRRLSAARVEATVAVGDTPLRAAGGYGAVWVSVFSAGTVARVDPATAKVTGQVPVGAEPEGVVAAFGSVWVVLQKQGQLVRIDPGRRAVTGRVPIPAGSRLVAAGPDALWVSDFAGGTLVRVDPRTAKVRRTPRLCGGPQGVLATAARVWVACTTDGTVLSVRPETGRVLARVPVGGAPDPVAAGPGGRVLVALQKGPALVTLDPAAASVVGRRVLGRVPALADKANIDLVVSGRTGWVSSYFESRVYRITL